MRVHVVSDVHGNTEALSRAGDGADALVVLGDLVDFVDYYEHDKGILGRIFGAEKVGRFAELRRGPMGPETGLFLRSLWGSLDDPRAVVDEAVRAQYAEMFAAMTAPTYAIPGNVDSPALWPEFAREGLYMVDGQVVDIGGLRFGFAGGALLARGHVLPPDAPWLPYLRYEEDFSAAVEKLTDIDVLCSHIPPSVAELTYDVIARRPEAGSSALLEAIHREQPLWSVFGHVHQPMSRRVRIGRTECVNVGHFQRLGRPYALQW